MARTVLLVSGERLLTGSALRSLGCQRQPAWIFAPASTSGPPLRSRWCAGVVPPASDDLPADIVAAAEAVGATHVIPDTVDMFAAVTAVADELAPAVPFPCSPVDVVRRVDN